MVSFGIACYLDRRADTPPEGILGRASLVSLLLAAGIAALMACSQAARPAAAPAEPAQGGGKPPTEPAPTPQPAAPAEKSWTINAADFGDDEPNLTGAVSSRSAPYAWERLTGREVRVSIDGHELPFTSTSAKPVFASDLSGAEWTVTANVRAGALALVLTAPDQSGASDTVESVAITNPGSGYASVPTVTFGTPPSGGTTAAGAAVGSVDSVTVGTAGSGYATVPSVTFGAPLAGGTTAAGAAVGSVDSVTVGTAGSGYATVPSVTFGAPLAGGTTATGAAVVGSGSVDSGDGRDRREWLHVGSQRHVRSGAGRRRHGYRHRRWVQARRFGDGRDRRERLHVGSQRHVRSGAGRRHHGNRHCGPAKRRSGSDSHVPGELLYL